MTGNGLAIFDFDNDDHPDILFADGKSPILYRNRGKGTFEDVSARSGFRAREWGQGVCVGDFDNDGWTDLLLTYYGSNMLYRNRDGAFEDVTAAAGLPVSGSRFGTGCAFVDYDRDGLLDLIVSNYVAFDIKAASQPGPARYCSWKGIQVFCGPRGFPSDRPILYHNEGRGKFRDVTGDAIRNLDGLHYGLGVVASDFDDDGWPDIYIACDSTPSILLHNNKDGTFTDMGVSAGVAYGPDGEELGSMGVAAADLNGDQQFDLVKTNFVEETPSLHLNLGDLFFRDATVEAGLAVSTRLVGWGIAAADFDHDGRPDILMANGHVYPELGPAFPQPKSLYWNGGGVFKEYAGSAGAVLSVPAPSRGLAIGDPDGDGTLEAVVSNMNASPTVLKNVAPKGNSLRIRLEGVKSNRSGIGARVMVSAGGRKQTDELRSGGSYASQHELVLHFGMGASSKADEVEIRWPSGVKEVLEKVSTGQLIYVREGAGITRRAAWR
jgi:hypothetical protein